MFQHLRAIRLTTENQIHPLGIDSTSPVFGWQLTPDAVPSMQTSYRLRIYDGPSSEEPSWDSGEQFSSLSQGIRCPGFVPCACTRYYWEVSGSLDSGGTFASEKAWFETGLLGTDPSVWDHAQWIGAPGQTVNPQAAFTYQVELDFRIESGGTAGIVLSARDRDNFNLFEIDLDRRRLYLREYCDNAWDGSYAEGAVPTVTALGESDGYPLGDSIPDGGESRFHRLLIHVEETEPKSQLLSVAVNGRPLLTRAEGVLPKARMFTPDRSFLGLIGFRQPSSCASYRNITVTALPEQVVLQQEKDVREGSVFSALGDIRDGVLVVNERFDLVSPVPAVRLFTTFPLEKEIIRARLYASARGFYEVTINGRPADDSFFHPGFTDYRKRIAYQTYDVTGLLRDGENRLEATVAKGYYSGTCGYSGKEIYGRQNTFLGKLVLTCADGEVRTVVTGPGWFFLENGPVQESGYLDGEYYDARLEACESSAVLCGTWPWPPRPEPSNGMFDAPEAFELSAEAGPPVQVYDVLRPQSLREMPAGHFVYDFGQNMVGTVRLKVKGPRGLSLRLRYGEMAYPDGEMYFRNVRSAANTDVYTLKGDKEGETFLPSFTSHGFRYVQLTGNGCPLEDSSCVVSLEALVLTNTPEVTGQFECSDPLINRLQQNIQWGQRGNSLLVFTDCPQRNERMGWTGDAQVFVTTAAFNMEIQSFARKWLLDVRDAQRMYNRQGAVPDTAPLGGDNRPRPCAGWADAAVIFPWELWKAYGNLSILKDQYESMKAWVDYQALPAQQNRGLRTPGGRPDPEHSDLARAPFLQTQQPRGDHLAFDVSTPFILSATAYAARSSDLLSRTASLLGKEDDAAFYRRRFEQVRQAFRDAWVQEDGSLAYWGEMSRSQPEEDGTVPALTRYSHESGNRHLPSQTAYALAIAFDLMPEETLPQTWHFFAQTILEKDCHLSVGFLGISHLLPALSKAGMDGLAFRLLEQETHPGWLYSVVNGATTIWERWNSYIAETGTFGDVSMNSFNHYSYGSVGEWLYQRVLGIRPLEGCAEAGYHRFLLEPCWGGTLSWARGSLESPYGRITSSWERADRDGIPDAGQSESDGLVVYRCTVPANSQAMLRLPEGSRPLEGSLTSGLHPDLRVTPSGARQAVFSLLPGTYRFLCPNQDRRLPGCWRNA